MSQAPAGRPGGHAGAWQREMPTRRGRAAGGLGALLLGVCLCPPALGGLDPLFAAAYDDEEAYRLTAWGKRYEAGVGVDRDAFKAIRLYCKAAARGDAEAEYRLGQVYAFARGIPNDREAAIAWFQAAAESGHTRARAALMAFGVDDAPRLRPACPVGEAGRPAPAPARAAPDAIDRLVHQLAPRYGLDPALVLAVVEAESGFDPRARSAKDAQGLMQLIPATALRFGVRDVWDPEENLRGGMAYLRWLLERFDGDLELALAGYNAGEGAVERHGGIPPYRETRAYVARVVGRLGTGQR